MILPCPAFAAGFFAFAAVEVEEDWILGLDFGAGSSSENDSQAASSFVTVYWGQFEFHVWQAVNAETPGMM